MANNAEGNQKRIDHFKRKHAARDKYIVRTLETNPTIPRKRIAEVCDMTVPVLNQWISMRKADGRYDELKRDILNSE